MTDKHSYDICPFCSKPTETRFWRVSSYRPVVQLWRCGNTACDAHKAGFHPVTLPLDEILEYVPLKVERNAALYERMRLGQYTPRLEAARQALFTHYRKWRTPSEYPEAMKQQGGA